MYFHSKGTLQGIEDDLRRIVRHAADKAENEPQGQHFSVEEVFEASLSEFAQNKEKCCDILAMFADDASKIEYVREIAFKILQKAFGPLFAVAYTDGMSFDFIDSHTPLVEEKLADGSLPALHNSSERGLFQFLKTTYIFEQYKYPPHVFVHTGDVFLDCGACFGDVALWAIQCGASRVFCFEPDPANFPLLEQNIREFAPHGRISPIKLAFGEEKGELRFTSNISSSRFTADGEIAVEVSTLDSWCREHSVRPDFIKMDIEGAEPAALAGGRETIAHLQPRLAISLYHNFSDLWEIPLALKTYNPGYIFYCKKFHPIHECILFCKSA